MILSLVLAISAAASAPSPVMPLTEAVKGKLAAVGADPSWNLQVDGDALTLTESIDDDENIETYKLVSGAAAGADGHVWQAGALTLTITATACSDGTTAYPYTSEVKIAGKNARAMKGCAYRPWGQDVLSALPVIDACLKGQAEGDAILYAAATAPDAGLVLFGTENDDGGFEACTVTAGQANTAAMPFGDAPPGTSAEVFVRGSGKNPGGECYDAPEVKDAAGKLVGWWLDPEGC